MNCSVAGCERLAEKRTWCATHYRRWQRGGDVRADVPIVPLGRPIEERFWEKVDKDGPIPSHAPHLGKCWVWTHSVAPGGHGKLQGARGEIVVASRLGYELQIGDIPEGLSVLHKCDNRPCVRGSHLFVGTQKDNMQDMSRKGRGPGQNPTHCIHGHEYTPENTLFYGKRKQLICKTCQRLRDAAKWNKAS